MLSARDCSGYLNYSKSIKTLYESPLACSESKPEKPTKRVSQQLPKQDLNLIEVPQFNSARRLSIHSATSVNSDDLFGSKDQVMLEG